MPRTRPFDEHAQRYDRWFEENARVFESEIRAVGHLLPSSGRGLEIGVGSGRFAAPLGIAIGVEPSSAMRRLAESRGIEVVDGVAERLPFADATFDWALMVTTICFVDDLPASFGEAARVLAERGEIVVGFVDRDSPLGQAYLERKGESAFYGDATFWGAREVVALLSEAGFAEHEAVQTVFGPPGTVDSVQDFEPGFGRGGFAVLRARKTSA